MTYGYTPEELGYLTGFSTYGAPTIPAGATQPSPWYPQTVAEPTEPKKIIEPQGCICPVTGALRAEGTTRFDEAGIYTCQSGAWIRTGESPIKTKEEEPEPIISGCEEGTTSGTGVNQYTCINGKWVYTGEAPTGYEPGEPSYGEPWAVGSPEWMEEHYWDRWAGMGTALGLYGKQGLSPYEQYLKGQLGPTSALYDIYGRMSTVPGYGYEAPGMFSPWGARYAQDPFAMYGMARGMMGDVFGMTPEERGMADLGYESGAMADLMRMGLRPQLGRQTAQWLAGKLPVMREAWQAQYPGWTAETAGAGQPSFYDYARQKYNIGQYF